MKSPRRRLSFFSLSVAGLMTSALVGCGGGSGSAGATGGASATGGVGLGGRPGTGGVAASGGTSHTGGTSGTGGEATGGSSATGGRAGASGGASATGGGPGGTGARGGTGPSLGGGAGGGRGGAEGGPDAGSSTGGAGSRDAAIADGGGADAIAGDFDPCAPSGQPCKILPLGDSITLGTNYPGGYRIKLYAHAVADKKNLTFVGYDTANPPSASVLSALGTAGAAFSPKHEGHFAWTIQQVDDLITGVATSSQDGVSYRGKKIVADAHPQIVLVHLGSNDVQVQPAGASDRLAKLVDHVVADAPDALVVVASIIPLPAQASNVSTLNQAIPGIVKARAAAGKHVIYVDQFAGFSGKTGLMDAVHPYEAGYEQMATVWYAAIKPYLH